MQTLQNQTGTYKTMQIGMAVLALLMAGVFYFGAIRPTEQQRGVVASMTSSLKSDLAIGQIRAQNLPAVKAEVDLLRSRLERFDKKLPKKPDMDQFMREITRVSEEAALKKVTVQPGSPRRSELFSEMPIALNFTGDFNSVVSFLKQTEEMQRLTRVRSLAIKTKDPQQGSVEVDVSMSIYFADE